MRIIIAVLLGILALTGCSNEAPTSGTTAGSYVDSDGKFEAEVSKDLIEIYILGDDSKSLYWSGTWSHGQTVTSDADVEKLEASLMGSQNPTKEFSVGADTIKFEFTMMGTTSDVVLEKES